MKNIVNFIKREFVLTIAGVLAIISMVFVPISKDYINYIDFSVLAILFCLMAVVAGFMKSGMFDYLSSKLLAKSNNIKVISAVLTCLCFFSAMLITNDVALITFVPLTIAILHSVSEKRLIFVIVIETISANLGSMLTPIGNPQNLYIYSFYDIEIWKFFKTIFPVWILSLIIILAMLLLGKSKKIDIKQEFSLNTLSVNKKQLVLYLCLFVLGILTVLRILDYRIYFLVTVIILLIFDNKIFSKIDYGLLFTFIAFFVFVGNLSNIAIVKETLANLIKGQELLVSVITSQLISNVPAAVMLSGFTDNVSELLVGVNIGGLGTLIASLASLISYKFYIKRENARPLLFFCIFTILNISLLIILFLFSNIILK